MKSRTTGLLQFTVLPQPVKFTYLPVAGIENVIGGVVDAAERPGRPMLVAFGGVVEHHVEDDLDARLMKARAPCA